MAKYGAIIFKGKSGKKYSFRAYSFNTKFNAIGGVYFVTRRTVKNGKITHTKIYVGQTDDLSTRFDNHHKADCFAEHNANCICVLLEEDEDVRLDIETDLIDNYDLPCNG
jgi:hypothetical protein